MKKRAELTVYIIIGLVLVALAGFLVGKFSNEEYNRDTYFTIDANQESLEIMIKACLRQTVVNGEIEYGLDPKWSTPLIKNYVLKEFPKCIDNFNEFKKLGFSVETSEMDVSVNINYDALIVDLTYPVSLTREDVSLNFEHRSYRFPRTVMEDLKFTEITRVVSTDGTMILEIPPGTTATVNGKVVDEVGIKQLDREFMGLSNSVLNGMLAFAGMPHGTVFSQPVTITIFYKEDDLPIYVQEKDIRIGYYDSKYDLWIGLETEVDPVKNMLKITTNHFSQWGSVSDCHVEEGQTAVVESPTLIFQDCLPCHEEWTDEFTGETVNIDGVDRTVKYSQQDSSDFNPDVGVGAIPICEGPATIGSIEPGSVSSPDCGEGVGAEEFCVCDNDVAIETLFSVCGLTNPRFVADDYCASNPGTGSEPFGDQCKNKGEADDGTEFNTFCYCPTEYYIYSEEGISETEFLERVSEVVDVGWEESHDPPVHEEGLLQGYNEYYVEFLPGGDSCIAVTGDWDGAEVGRPTVADDDTVELGAQYQITGIPLNPNIEGVGEGETLDIIIKPVCDDQDTCIVTDAAIDVDDDDAKVYAGLQINNNFEATKTCFQGGLVFELHAVGAHTARYFCNSAMGGKYSFVRGECKKCMDNNVDPEDTDIWEWMPSEDCVGTIDCAIQLEGVVKDFDGTCKVCRNGEWELGGDCSGCGQQATDRGVDSDE